MSVVQAGVRYNLYCQLCLPSHSIGCRIGRCSCSPETHWVPAKVCRAHFPEGLHGSWLCWVKLFGSRHPSAYRPTSHCHWCKEVHESRRSTALNPFGLRHNVSYFASKLAISSLSYIKILEGGHIKYNERYFGAFFTPSPLRSDSA